MGGHQDFGETHLDFLKQYGDFEQGIPVHDTIARVVSCISPNKFHECFINWMRDCHSSEDGSVIAIDGKTLRGSYDKSRRRGAIHVISVFCAMGGVVPGQLKTAEKSNEITAIPELINLLDIKGKIITTDAMECQKDIAEKIVSQDVLNDSIEQEFCGLTVTGCASSPNAWSGAASSGRSPVTARCTLLRPSCPCFSRASTGSTRNEWNALESAYNPL